MAIEPDEFLARSPFGYHVTRAANLPDIRKLGTLFTAQTLLSSTGHEDLLTRVRAGPVAIEFRGGSVEVSGQVLVEDEIAFGGGWDIGMLLTELNARVFLWPGDRLGVKGKRASDHIATYEARGEFVFIRLPLMDIVRARPSNFFVSRYNSGASRRQPIGGVPRDPFTYVSLSSATFKPGKITELSIRADLPLPQTTEWARRVFGPWTPLKHNTGAGVA